MNVALFGATGYVGGYLLHNLVKNNHHPIIQLRHGSESKITIDKGRIHSFYGEIDDHNSIKRVLESANAVIYNIGIIREYKRKGVTFEKLHYQGLKNVVDAAKDLNIKRFILMSANGAERCKTGYQIYKHKAEQYLQESGLDWTIFRPSLVFGDPGKDKIEFCTDLKKKLIGIPFPAPLFFRGLSIFNAGEFRMSPIHASNVAEFFVKSLSMPETISKVYELGGKEEISWKNIIQVIAKSMGKKRKLAIPVPAAQIEIAAYMFDRFSWFPITRGQISMLLDGNTCDSTEYFREFNISPIEFSVENLKYISKA